MRVIAKRYGSWWGTERHRNRGRGRPWRHTHTLEWRDRTLRRPYSWLLRGRQRYRARLQSDRCRGRPRSNSRRRGRLQKRQAVVRRAAPHSPMTQQPVPCLSAVRRSAPDPAVKRQAPGQKPPRHPPPLPVAVSGLRALADSAVNPWFVAQSSNAQRASSLISAPEIVITDLKRYECVVMLAFRMLLNVRKALPRFCNVIHDIECLLFM
ncbi:uncharacterized protein ACIQIH_000438 isoform 1-T1 [Cyanocitta cristata]